MMLNRTVNRVRYFITDNLWEHILFPLITTPDHDELGGGRLRDNRVCHAIDNLFWKIG